MNGKKRTVSWRVYNWGKRKARLCRRRRDCISARLYAIQESLGLGLWCICMTPGSQKQLGKFGRWYPSLCACVPVVCGPSVSSTKPRRDLSYNISYTHRGFGFGLLSGAEIRNQTCAFSFSSFSGCCCSRRCRCCSIRSIRPTWSCCNGRRHLRRRLLHRVPPDLHIECNRTEKEKPISNCPDYYWPDSISLLKNLSLEKKECAWGCADGGEDYDWLDWESWRRRYVYWVLIKIENRQQEHQQCLTFKWFRLCIGCPPIGYTKSITIEEGSTMLVMASEASKYAPANKSPFVCCTSGVVAHPRPTASYIYLAICLY